MRKSTIIILFLVLLFQPDLIIAQKDKERKHRKSDVSNTMIDKKAATEIFIEATKARILGDDEKAISLFTRSLELDPTNDASMYELSQIYFQRNDYLSAIRLIEQAIEIDPENKYYQLLALEIYGKSGRKEDLMKGCLQLVKQFPENVDYRYELATAYLLMGKGEEAIEAYNSIEEIIGVSEEVSLQKHRIYMMLNKPDKAIKEIKKLLEVFPDNASRYYSILAEIYMQDKKPDIAAEYYQKIIETDPDNPYVHISLSEYYRNKGDVNRSLEELKAGFSNPSLDVDTKIRVMMAYYSIQEIYNEKKQEAFQLSELILKASPRDPKALTLNADLLMNNKSYSEARDRYRQVIAIDSSRYSVWENLLQSEASLVDWVALKQDSERAMDLFPFQPLPYFFNGAACLQLKNSNQAIKALNAGCKLVADNQPLLIQFYTYLGDAYNQVQQNSLSDEYYDKVIRLDSNNSYVLNNYAYYLSLRGENMEKAHGMARKAALLDSLNPANLDTYGWVLFKQGKFDQAKIWVEKAIVASSKDDPDILEHYGDILFQLGETVSAVNYWEKALKAGTGSGLLEQKVKEKKFIE